MNLTGIEVEGFALDHDFQESLSFSGHNAILDSGTTYSYFNYNIFN